MVRLLAMLMVVALAALPAQAERVRRVAHMSDATDRLIVKFSDTSGARAQGANGESARQQRVAALAARTGVPMTLARSVSESTHAVRVGRIHRGDELRALMSRVARDPGVVAVAPDLRRYRARVPNDPLYGTGQITQQWWLTTPSATLVSPIDAERAWDITTGSARVVVAVLDSGVLFDHPDLGRFDSGGKLLPGYDMVGGDEDNDALRVANDGSGRDGDPSDPGDWIDATDVQFGVFFGCDESDSSWHGTRVAGIVGARSNNGLGVAGVGWGNYVLPVRVLGKCFGYDSDIVAGMRWAGGLSVPGAPNNPFPARVINMSLGSPGSCTFPYQDSITDLKSRHVLVVAAAGNESQGQSVTPGNCPGVVSVTALRHVGTKVGFANWGTDVAIAAPGGNCVNLTGSCLYPIVSTGNTATRGPSAAGMNYDGELGSSFSTPMAAGVAGLMLAAHPTLTFEALRGRLLGSARPFPAADPTLLACSDPAFVPDANGDLPNDGQCNCTQSSCGSGMLDAFAAVSAALRPQPVISPTVAPTVGQPLALDARGSTAALGASIAAYRWSITFSSPPGAALTATEAAQTSLTFPSGGVYTVRLEIVDSAGRSDARTCTVNVAPAGNTPQCAGQAAAALPRDVFGVAFDPATGIVRVPEVKVGVQTYIDVTLKYFTEDQTFRLQTATELVPAGPAQANYDAQSGILTLPTVKVGAQTYVNVTLRNAGNYRFTLQSATQQP